MSSCRALTFGSVIEVYLSGQSVYLTKFFLSICFLYKIYNLEFCWLVSKKHHLPKFGTTPSQLLQHFHIWQMSTEEFVRMYEKPYIPVVIKGVIDSWPAQNKWTLQASASFVDLYVKCIDKGVPTHMEN